MSAVTQAVVAYEGSTPCVYSSVREAQWQGDGRKRRGKPVARCNSLGTARLLAAGAEMAEALRAVLDSGCLTPELRRQCDDALWAATAPSFHHER